MFRKKGQLTIFIIITLILIISVGLLFYFTKAKNTNLQKNTGETNTIQNDRTAINNFIQNCVVIVAKPLILEIAKKGGTLIPNSKLYWNGTELNILATFKTGTGYENSLLLKQDIEKELSGKINQDLKSCINLELFRDKGYEISEKERIVNVTINEEEVVVKLNYPLNFKLGTSSADFNEFVATIEIPLGRVYKTVIDIANEEIKSGQFDKEDFMLKQGGKITIEKHKPYPNTVYVLKTRANSGDNLVFQFAIKGKDTAGKEAITYDNNYGCCTNKADGMCFKNVEASKCFDNIYNDDTSCECEKNVKQSAEGCCEANNNCKLTTEKECPSNSGKFYKGDLRCSQASCGNMDCRSIYNYVRDDFSGSSKKNGESWCSYESVVGKGLDYVGTRHYLHSCINGKEYAEECRDYREELCTEGVIGVKDKLYSKGTCRINRWYDCATQQNQYSCEDARYRDCYWSGFLYSQLKCNPQVPPGFKFWEGNGESVCNAASLDKDDFGKEYPASWGHSALLYCQRMGDCGNYRNVADVITTLGYYNRDGTLQSWVYGEDGLIKKGNEFVLKLSFYDTGLAGDVSLPAGTGKSDAKCNLWDAPVAGNCGLCKNSKLHPCTEYKCRSLGKNCIFIEKNQSCISSLDYDKTPPVISLNRIPEGYSYQARQSNYYKEGIEYTITPDVKINQPFIFNFSTSEPTRCRVSLQPPNIDPKLIANLPLLLPEILLNDFEYKINYNVTFRFPYFSLTKLDSYELFIKCNDKAGNPNDQEFIMKINTEENSNSIPEIINIKADRTAKGSPNNFNIFVNEPFNSCRYSASDANYEEMSDLNCKAGEDEILYDINRPLGSYLCPASISMPAEAEKLYFACENKGGKRNVNYIYEVS